MQTPEPDITQLKQRMRTTWMTGDFGKIAKYTAKTAAEFVDRLDLRSGMNVLDVACGTGNLAIPAARSGARVTGVDIASNLLEQARQRAAAESLTATFDEGDAEQLPYPNDTFDVVMTMFGAMFAPRPELAAAQLFRVCRPTGTVAMANWTREGFVGKMFAASARLVPPPPGVPPPVLWGDEATVQDRFRDKTSKITLTRRTLDFDYPLPPHKVVALFREYFGPTNVAFSRLDVAGQTALAADLEKLWVEHNRADGDRTRVSAEYLEVIATKP
jgi:SAM-dependent methyltransferase